MGLVSLARKAGKLARGEEMTKNAIRARRCFLVILASDAGANTVKSIRNSCAYYCVPYVIGADKASLGRATGSAARAVVGILDEGFANGIQSLPGVNLNGGGEYAETEGIRDRKGSEPIE